MKPEIIIAPNQAAWAKTATDLILQHGQQALAKRGNFSLVLSGGSTPRPVFQLLTEQAEQLDWQRVHIFWGDERCVPPEHAESNFRMAKETLLNHIPLPQQNIFRLLGEIDPPLAAQDYEEMIAAYFYRREKRFDLILLGLGEDGHTASLFPGTPALDETRRWVVDNPTPSSDAIRLTMTYPALNSARQIIFLVNGLNKSKVVAEVVHQAETTSSHPAAYVAGGDTPPTWILDKPAASQL